MRVNKYLYVCLGFLLSVQVTLADFNPCAFNFGRYWHGTDSDYTNINFVYTWIGWDNFGSVERELLEYVLQYDEKEIFTPAYFSYLIAFMAKKELKIDDCNVSDNNLCKKGAGYIRENRDVIVTRYGDFAKETAKVYGTERTLIWLLEPDFHQYTTDEQEGGGISYPEMASLLQDIIEQIMTHMPNALISMDVSPWIDQQPWLSSFTHQFPLIDYMNTSGGSSNGASSKIFVNNHTTYQDVFGLTQKQIIADAGYGVDGADQGHNYDWDDINNLNARISEGLIGLSQSNPDKNWLETITALKEQLIPLPYESEGCREYQLREKQREKELLSSSVVSVSSSSEAVSSDIEAISSVQDESSSEPESSSTTKMSHQVASLQYDDTPLGITVQNIGPHHISIITSKPVDSMRAYSVTGAQIPIRPVGVTGFAIDTDVLSIQLVIIRVVHQGNSVVMPVMW